MIKFETIQDFMSQQGQEIINSLIKNYGTKFLVVFDLKNQSVIGFYCVKNIIVQDEQNRKTFFIKGYLLNNFSSLIQQGGIVSNQGIKNNFIDILDSLTEVNHTFSDNMFGFIGFGIIGY